MTRRILALTIAAVAVAADPAREAADVISGMAADLTAGNAPQFLAAFDRGMPGYEKLRVNVEALARDAETQSYIEILTNEGDDHARTIVLTWELRVKRDVDAVATARKEVRVTCKLQRQGKRWKIVSMSPWEFLAP